MSEPGAKVWVDPETGQVMVGSPALEPSAEVEVDLRTGRAAVEFGGRRFAIRTIRWDEQAALARFAHLGSAFVSRQLAGLAAQGEGGPADAGQEDVLAAVATWLAVAGRAAPLDLDPVGVATATRDVCRSLGIAPADLDGRPAPDVAALWRSCAPAGRGPAATAGGVTSRDAAPSRPAEGDDGYTTILVVPDAEPPGAVQPADGAARQGGGPERTATPADLIDPPPATAAPAEAALAAAGPASPSTVTPPDDAGAAAPADTTRQRRAPPRGPWPHAADRPGQDAAAARREHVRVARPGALRFRVMPPSPHPDPDASPPGGAPAAGPAADRDRTAFPGTPASWVQRGPGTETAPAVRPGRAMASSPRDAAVIRPGTVPSVRGEHGPPAAGSHGEMRLPPYAAAPGPSGSWTGQGADMLGQDGWETLFDELAERLEEAAAQMGIDLEG